jgi:hypothetical protein
MRTYVTDIYILQENRDFNKGEELNIHTILSFFFLKLLLKITRIFVCS